MLVTVAVFLVMMTGLSVVDTDNPPDVPVYYAEDEDYDDYYDDYYND